jgi:hypothetical protein
VIEAARHVSSHLAFRAEGESAASWREHADDDGRLPPEIAERASLLARLSAVLGLMARHAGS